MLDELKHHNNRISRESYFYWLFLDVAIVGRKKRQKQT